MTSRAVAATYTCLSVPSLLRKSQEGDGRRPPIAITYDPGQTDDRGRRHCSTLTASNNFTIFEGASESQGLIIGRAVTGPDTL